MFVNAASQDNLIVFYKNPEKFVLSVDEHKDGISVNLLEKGFRTWIKIHVGGLFGLFNSTNVKMRHISRILLNIQSQEENFVKFKKAFLDKKIKFENEHFPLFVPHREKFDIEKSDLSFLNDKKDAQISNEIINHLKSVGATLLSSVYVQKSEKRSYISLQLRSLKEIKKDSEEIDSKNILNSALLGSGQCEKDVIRLAQRGYKKIYIHLTHENKDEISAEITAL